MRIEYIVLEYVFILLVVFSGSYFIVIEVDKFFF